MSHISDEIIKICSGMFCRCFDNNVGEIESIINGLIEARGLKPVDLGNTLVKSFTERMEQKSVIGLILF